MRLVCILPPSIIIFILRPSGMWGRGKAHSFGKIQQNGVPYYRGVRSKLQNKEHNDDAGSEIQRQVLTVFIRTGYF
jgi:hypothetical protein